MFLISAAAQAKCPESRECIMLLCAAADIEEGSTLGASSATACENYHPYIEADAFIYTTDAGKDILSGARALVKIPSGAQIKKNALTKRGEGFDAKNIPARWRGYWLETDKNTYIALDPLSARVDILAGMNALVKGDSEESKLALTLLQRITVQQKAEIAGKYYFLLQLDPRDAQFLLLMQQEADIKLILRRFDDTSISALAVTKEAK